MVRLLARVLGIGVETADMLVHEILYRKLRDEKAVARYAGVTGSPDESGTKRREKGLAKAGNARVRRGSDPTRLAACSSSNRTVPWCNGIGRGSPRRAQDQHDRGARPKAAHRAVAHGEHWRDPGRLRAAAGCLTGGTNMPYHRIASPAGRAGADRLTITIRGGGDPT